MDPSSLLAQLRDIHSPEDITWWPIAFGWWILAILVIGTAIFSVIYISRWYKKTAWRRSAIKEFKKLKLDYLEAPNTNTLSELNALLKRCTASALCDPSYLALSTQQWAEFLLKQKTKNSGAILKDSEVELLSEGLYMPVIDELGPNEFQRIEKWIKSLN